MSLAWEQYKQLCKNEGNDLGLVILNKVYELKNQTEIHIELSNDLELDRLQTIKPALLLHLRTSLENHNIDIFAEVRYETSAKKDYTNAEKFNTMTKKNVNLIELKNRLGLDLDI